MRVREESAVMEAEVEAMWLLAWRIEGSHDPRNMDGPCKLEKARKQIPFSNLHKEHNPAENLFLGLLTSRTIRS